MLDTLKLTNNGVGMTVRYFMEEVEVKLYFKLLLIDQGIFSSIMHLA